MQSVGFACHPWEGCHAAFIAGSTLTPPEQGRTVSVSAIFANFLGERIRPGGN
jgi:hypothetical protein